MATPFARIDLAPNARDFRPIALEPGVPLLDQSSANDKIVFRWLGGMAAEPVWRGDSVIFYVRDDRGGRLTDVTVQPATSNELRGPLAEQLDELRGRLEKAQPETSTEVTLHRALLEAFHAQADDEHRADLDAFFFKWRSTEGGDAGWRLAWAWGYRRVDKEPVPAAVCTDPECRLLFMRRAGNPKCPGCSKDVPTGPKKPKRRGRQVLLPLLLLLILAALVWWWTHPPRLVVRPYEIAGPSGSRVEMRVLKMGLLPFYSEDVTRLCEGYTIDPTVAGYDSAAGEVTLGGLGQTRLRFHMGAVRPAEVLVEVGPAVEPDELLIMPEKVELAIGSTSRLKLIGRMEDGTEYDLTPLGEWLPQPESDQALFSWNGFLEGIGEGQSTVTAQYRPTPDSPPQMATASVTVKNVEFAALEVEVLPAPVGLNRASRLRVDAVGADGERYSVLQSSRLRTELKPTYLGRLAGPYLHGEAVGTGSLSATFREQSGAASFEVKPTPGVGQLTVAPERLDLVVGQRIDLAVATPSTVPVELVSADRRVVSTSGNSTVIAHATGETQITVAQGGQTQTIPVSVTRGEILGLDMRPRLAVVPVDHEIRPRVLARVRVEQSATSKPTGTAPWDRSDQSPDTDSASADSGADPSPPTTPTFIERQIELAPEAIRTLAEPSPRFASFYRRGMELSGNWPSRQSEPQRLAFQAGGEQTRTAVHVIVAPMMLELKPRGPVELPLGQLIRLDGWAHYSGGRNVLVYPNRLEFDRVTGDDTKPGIELRRNRVAALKAGGGPLGVVCSYFDNRSNQVDFTSVEADPNLKLRLSTDRTLRLVGETGFVELYGHGPKGDVELVPEMSQFGTTAAETIKVNENSGAFRASGPGAADLTAEHPAATEGTSLPFEVYEPSQASLAFDPPRATVAVDEVSRLRLMLQVQDGEEMKEAELLGPGVAYTIGRPEAIAWEPPKLTGRSPAGPFDITGGLYPYLERPATARVEVVPRPEVGDLRVVPSDVTLAPGQRQSLRVERYVAGAAQGATAGLPGSADGESAGQAPPLNGGGPTDSRSAQALERGWKTVRPESVEWSVPPGVIFTPAAGGLPPTVELPEGASGQFELTAEYGDSEALAVIDTGEAAPDVHAENNQMVLDREPPGRYIAEGTAQRYNVMVETPSGERIPAANVRWPEPFENDYVVWAPPVLFAKRPGYVQWLRADVDGRTLLFSTATYRPATAPAPEQPVPPSGDRPVLLRIVSDQGPAVEFPVGARFDDFRVEAEYSDGFVQIVTDEANLRTDVPAAQAPLSASGAMLVGVRPGQATVQADYMGLSTQQGLQATVTADANPDGLRIRPSPATVMLGETIPLEVEGLKGDRSIGLLTGLSGVSWQSANPSVAGISGPSLTGNSLGKTEVTTQFKGVTSKECPVSVVRSIGDALVVDPKVIRLRVGQSVALGPDVRIIRGDLDLSRQCRVTPALPGVVRYDSATHSLVGVAPGTSPVAFTHGEKLSNVNVEVFYGGKLEGDIVVEPATGILARGQALPLRVYVLTTDGQRIDRTTSAVFRSSAEGTVAMRGNRACGLAPGEAEVRVILPELPDKVGRASVAVNNQPIESLSVEPAQLDLGTGDRASLRILGRAASGTHELFAQPDLTVQAGGPSPSCISVGSASQINAVTPGEASVSVAWQNRLRASVPVQVSDYTWNDLTLDPGRAAVQPGEALVYQLTAMRGGQRRVLTASDDVELFTSDPGVARAVGGMAVQATGTGQTSVIARIGGKQIAAQLDVVPGSGLATTDLVGTGIDTYGIDSYGGDSYGVTDGVTGRGYRRITSGDPVWDAIIGDGTRTVVRRDGRDGVVRRYIDDGLDVIAGRGIPGAEVVGLQFIPDTLRLPMSSPGTRVQVVERLEDGRLGRDVSNNPNLEIRSPEPIASMQRTEQGLLIAPKQPGATRLTANLGPMTADPMLLTVGDANFTGARLRVSPDPLVLWTGQEGTFSQVELEPSGGQWSFPVDYRIEPEPGQGVVQTVDDVTLLGTAEGQARVRVTAVAPGQEYDGVSTAATVSVRRSDPIVIEPSDMMLTIGQSTPVVKVYAKATDGEMYQVPAELASMDPNVLVPDPLQPGQFSAQALGGTQIRATYRGREALAKVNVSGDRFTDVQTSLNEGDGGFSVTIEVLAAESAGSLEYRVYPAGQQPAENWVPSQPSATGGRRAVLRSPTLPYGERGKLYHLTLEAKNPADGSVQQYPLTFRLGTTIERVGGP